MQGFRQDHEPGRRPERPRSHGKSHNNLSKVLGDYDRREAVNAMFDIFNSILLRNGRNVDRDPDEVKEEERHRRERRAMFDDLRRKHLELPGSSSRAKLKGNP